ncbi:CotH kinase family protein [Desulfosporosinus shakirovi]|uniref:CotH kinase family protein n=1 Tax=Desulfosporosinus shakirovi TaxID=2885154 RepID=UPI001E2D373F|nr:CotH kinase family protein [Desulfosporosinus sp. SRJS8]MCB8815284.1 CotH kinase family protein [Desulfosporosinus sp. SRJS8]
MKFKLPVPFLLFGFVILLIIGVMSNGGFTQNYTSEASTSNSEVIDNNAVLDETVFPKDKVVDVKITIDDNDFQNLIENATEEEFKTASVEYNGIKLDNIGIRAKGNSSLRSISQSDSERYSFKLSFDEYMDNQTLAGLSKINLNNMYSDASYLREFLTYELAEAMGLPTPKYSYVNIYVNDELWGFYLAVEQIGDAYLERNYDNTTGELYKAEMNGAGSDLTWLGEDVSSYSSLVEKSKSSDNDSLINMLNELNNGSDYAKVLDVEEALGYVALNVLSANMDSYLGQNKHNYYLYENDGVFSILPWDYNMAFGGFGGSNILIDEPTQGALSERPLIAKLLQVEEYKATYHEMLSEAIEGYLSDAQFQTRVQELTQLIEPYVMADPSAFSTYEEYEQGVTQLLASNTSNVQTIAQQLEGTIPSSGDGSGSGDSRGGAMGRGQRENNAQGNEPTAPEGQPVANAQNTDTPAQVEQSPKGQTDPNQAIGQQQPNDQQNEAPPFAKGGQGGPPNGMGGRGGMGGDMNSTIGQGSVTELITTGISLVVLLLAGLFITFFKRKR